MMSEKRTADIPHGSVKRLHTSLNTGQREIKIKFRNFNPESQRETRAVDTLTSGSSGNGTDVVSKSDKLLEEASEKYEAFLKNEMIENEQLERKDNNDDDETIPLYEEEMKDDWNLLEMRTRDKIRQLAKESIRAKVTTESKR